MGRVECSHKRRWVRYYKEYRWEGGIEWVNKKRMLRRIQLLSTIKMFYMELWNVCTSLRQTQNETHMLKIFLAVSVYKRLSDRRTLIHSNIWTFKASATFLTTLGVGYLASDWHVANQYSKCEWTNAQPSCTRLFRIKVDNEGLIRNMVSHAFKRILFLRSWNFRDPWPAWNIVLWFV